MRKPNRQRLYWAYLVILLVPTSLTMGCSSQLQTYPARGKVQFPNGEPVMFGTIELMSETHPLNARGQIQRDGTFVLGTYEDDDGAIAGEHKVIIAQLFMSPIEMNIEHDHGDLVDEKYASYETSGLTCTITTRGSDNELILTVNKRN